MNNYFYVEVDDEITTVIGKLREEKSVEIFLVVPKRALVAQSLVNLKLLSKEAIKLKKKLVFVSPDSNTRKIASKAGLSVKRYVARASSRDNSPEASSPSDFSHKPKMARWEEEMADQELKSIIENSPEVASISQKAPSDNPFSQKIAVGAFSPLPPVKTSLKPVSEEKKLPEIIDLKKINQDKKQRLSHESSPKEPEPNPFKVKSLDEDKAEPTIAKKVTPKTNPAPSLLPLNQRENLNLPLGERNKLRELWMSQKGIVRGRNLDTKSRLDLDNQPRSNSERNELTTENQGLLRTTHRKVIGPGTIVDLRSNSSQERTNPLSERTVKQNHSFTQKNQTVLLPLFNTKLFLAFTLFIVLTLGILAGVILPEAKLDIKPHNNSEDLAIKAVVSGEVTEKDFANKTIPGDPIRFPLNLEGDYPASGEKDVVEKSGGKITITNSANEPLSLKQNAALVNKNGQKFFLVDPITVPAAKSNDNSNANTNTNENTNSTSSSSVAGSVITSLVAEKSGPEYALKEGTELTFPGLADGSFQNLVSVKVNKDLVVGETKKAKYVSAEDLQNAQKDLTDQAKQKALEEFQNKYGEKMGKLFSPESLQVENSNFVTDRKENDETESFHAKLETNFFVLIFQENNLIEMAKNVIEENQDQKNGSVLIKSYTPIGVNPLENRMEISAQVNYGVDSQLNLADIRKQIINKSRKEVTEYLDNDKEIEKYDLRLWPSWLPFMPILDKRIEVKIQ